MTIEIGTEFKNRKGQACKVTDILKTYNSKNDLVKVRYVVEHQLMGQAVIDNDVLEITIQKGFYQEVA